MSSNRDDDVTMGDAVAAGYVLPIWETAGLLVSGKGGPVFERELPAGSWWVPGNIWLDESDDKLLWTPSNGNEANGSQEGVLTEFARLGGATNEAILEYAQKWGVLELCGHGLPRTHNPPTVEPGEGWELRCLRVVAEGGNEVSGPFVEPLDRWRALAERVRAIIDLAAGMRTGLPGSRKQWTTALALDDEPVGPGGYNPLGPAWTGSPVTLAEAVEEMLAIGNVRPLFRWKGGNNYGVEIGGAGAAGITGSGLFGAIATQLAFMLSRSDGLAICSGCGEAFALNESRARTGRNRYCSRCREKGVDARERARAYRQRKKASTEN